MNTAARVPDSELGTEPGLLTQPAPEAPAWGPLLFLSALKIAAHLYSYSAYGYFRDELYYLDCAKRLDWGYVDQPPLSIALLALFNWILGTELWAVRIPSALAGGATVLLTGLLVWRMGGGRFAQSLCALAVLVSPLMLGVDSFYSMNVFDRLFWIGLMYLVVRAITTENPRYWIWFGVIAGLGLLNKYSVAFLGIGVLVGLLLTQHRRFLKSSEIWIGAALAALIFLPHVIWQVRHEFPTLEFMENATRFKMARKSFGDFALAQVIEMHPLNAPLWIAGTLYGLFAASASNFRILSVFFLFVFGLLGLQGGKAYYLSPAFPAVLALGAICLERWSDVRRWIRPVSLVLLFASGALLSALALPVVSPASHLRLSRALGLSPPAEEVGHRGAKLPQHLADRFGWVELVDWLAQAFHNLSPEDQRRCAILTGNYGEAGAVNFFGPARRLPRAICGHNQHYLWGPGNSDGSVMLIYSRAFDRQRLEALFESVEVIGQFRHPMVMPEQNEKTLYLCRGLRKPIKEFFKATKQFI